MRCGGTKRAYSFCATFHFLGIQRQNAAPCAWAVEEDTQLLVAFAVTLQLAVFKLDQRASRSIRSESNFDFAGPGGIRVTDPVRRIMPGANMPGEGDAMGRVPREHFAPVAQLAFNIPLVPPSSDPRFNEDGFEWCLADVMRCRPPRLHLFHENTECAVDGRLNAHALTYDGF